jgi:hypothetical protein
LLFLLLHTSVTSAAVAVPRRIGCCCRPPRNRLLLQTLQRMRHFCEPYEKLMLFEQLVSNRRNYIVLKEMVKFTIIVSFRLHGLRRASEKYTRICMLSR